MLRSISTILALTFLTACSSTPTENPTVFPYELDERGLAEASIERVIIAHVNLGGPSRNYLEEVEPQIDRAVTDYLKENGFTVLPQRLFEQEWKTALRIYGNPYDPTSGKMNQKTFALILISVRDALRKTQKLDAILFTDLIERDIAFSGGLKHLARWDGISRKPTLQGPGDGVSAGFDWNKMATGASLWVSIYNMELVRVFTSIGGLDATEAIDTRSSSGRYIKRRNILENEDHVREGIELAFHPFITMEAYPAPPRVTTAPVAESASN
jgi:hypothetical protein